MYNKPRLLLQLSLPVARGLSKRYKSVCASGHGLLSPPRLHECQGGLSSLSAAYGHDKGGVGGIRDPRETRGGLCPSPTLQHSHRTGKGRFLGIPPFPGFIAAPGAISQALARCLAPHLAGEQAELCQALSHSSGHEGRAEGGTELPFCRCPCPGLAGRLLPQGSEHH